jgi:hypothetical protein
MTQHDKILNLLRGRDWVPLPEILQLGIAQYGTRIHELKKRGYIIENRLLEVVGGQRHTAFRLVSEPVSPAAPLIPTKEYQRTMFKNNFTNKHLIA